MARALPLSDETVARDRADSVVRLEAVFEEAWIERLLAGFGEVVERPGPLSRVYADERDGAGQYFLFDMVNWTRIEAFRAFLAEAPAAAIAGQLMGANQARLLHDTIFFRARGTQAPSPFHQDMPYWPVKGRQACSIWMPLVPVAKQSALAFVPGSHRWEKDFARPKFSASDPHDLKSEAESYAALPPVEANQSRYGVVSWDMAPGDCVVFDAMVLHGGSGRLAPDRELRVFATNWIGDDVRASVRPGGVDPDFYSVFAHYGLREGDPLDCPAFPLLWSRS
ncbi:MAG: phytanoyl-CoA dioxygenase family protein [Pseudomonadota bacterium]